MQINEVMAKSIVTKSKLPGADYVINPYGGCSHSCIYCYARFMKRFAGHTEPWGDYVDVKVNAADLIPNSTQRFQGKTIFMSSVTDPYLHLEKRYQLTRTVLERLIPLEPNLNIQTKSTLILRDIDLLQRFERCSVGLTITTLDDDVRKELEPYTASVSERLEALKALKQAGVSTYAFIGPILPFITNWKNIVRKTRGYADFFMFENLNTRGSIRGDVLDWICTYHPNLMNSYQEIFRIKSDYWSGIKDEIADFCGENGIEHKIFFNH